MPNLLDYIAWRGDLSLEQDPLNENDELVLSQLAYVAFGEYVPGPASLPASVSVQDAARWLLAYDPEATKIHQTGYLWKENHALLRAAEASRRFAPMRLAAYVEITSSESEDEMQFAATTIFLPDGTTMLAYRGTDDSLVGWKEDLHMVFDCPIPAQRAALRYLGEVAAAVPGPLRLCGHSKGGNLAIFAASNCDDETAARILSVVSHDGPGQSEATITSDGYARIRDRLRVYIPHFSVVGMLLEHENNYKVVQSNAKRLMQHDAFSWQMQGVQMLCEDTPSEQSLAANQIIRQWINTLDTQDQRMFVEAVYEIATATYGDTLPDDVERIWPSGVQALFSGLLSFDAGKRSLFHSVLGELFSATVKSIRLPWHKEDEKRADLHERLDTVKLEDKPNG